MGTIKVKLRDDYKRSSHSVDATKVTKDEYSEVDEDATAVQNLLDDGILVKESESESSGDDSDSSGSDTDEEESFECDECGDSFDSERGVKAHKGQAH